MTYRLTPEILDALHRLTKAVDAIHAEQARRNAEAIEDIAVALERALDRATDKGDD
jgi:hypothetical protein